MSPFVSSALRSAIRFVIALVLGGAFVSASFAQNVQHTENNADQKLRSNARVNPSSAGMEMSVPLGSYAGRAGTGMPVALNYSSKVWRINHDRTFSVYAPIPYRTNTKAVYSEDSAAGWTTSTAPPWIEFTGEKQFYDYEGRGVELLDYDQMNGIYFVKRINIHLPDGSSPEFRKDDGYYDLFVACPSGQCPNYDYTGIYKAVDGSRAYYNFDNSTLYLPDGSRYVFAAGQNLIPTAAQYIDRNGNTLSYNATAKEWTDTLGRTIKSPLTTAAPTSRTDQTYASTGLGGVPIQYQLRWRYLKDPNTGESALSDPSQELRYTGSRNCDHPDQKNSYDATPYLFLSDNYKRICADSQRFNPVVLHEIVLPNNTAYKFSYNVYGEIDRVDYPTGGYERFEYSQVVSFSALDPYLYGRANRGVNNRWVSSGNGGAEALWQHGGPRVVDPNGTSTSKLITKEVYTDCSDCPPTAPFGFGNIFVGMPYEERTQDSSGVMLRRKLTRWTNDGAVTGGHSYATRNPRVNKEVEIILDTNGGSALASTTTYSHDADLNVTETKRYGFVAVDQYTAQNSPIENIPTGSLLRTEQATFLVNDPNIAQGTRDAYRARNMVGLPVMTRVLDANNNQVSRAEMRYDEYALTPYAALTSWQDPGTAMRGNPTTTRSWLDTTNTFIEAHVEYDQAGNALKTTDARGNSSQGGYTDSFSDNINRNTYAFPTSTTSAVPDPTNTYSTSAPLTTSTIYDYSTGLPTSTRDANYALTTFEYNDVLNRPTRVNLGGRQTLTAYDDVNRTVTITSDRDTYNDNVFKSQTVYDGLGRTVETRTYESPSTYIATRQEYDAMGRTKRSSNPFRPASESPQWTTPDYDALGRVLTVTTPDGAQVTTSYSGATVTVTDQAGKSRKSETDALGRLTNVWENPNGLNYQTDYQYDVLGNLRKVTQGSQQRYFSYDSLSRLTRAKNPEQAVNSELTLSQADSVTGHNAWSLAYTYDENGNLKTRTDARNVTMRWSNYSGHKTLARIQQ